MSCEHCCLYLQLVMHVCFRWDWLPSSAVISFLKNTIWFFMTEHNITSSYHIFSSSTHHTLSIRGSRKKKKKLTFTSSSWHWGVSILRAITFKSDPAVVFGGTLNVFNSVCFWLLSTFSSHTRMIGMCVLMAGGFISEFLFPDWRGVRSTTHRHTQTCTDIHRHTQTHIDITHKQTSHYITPMYTTIPHQRLFSVLRRSL